MYIYVHFVVPFGDFQMLMKNALALQLDVNLEPTVVTTLFIYLYIWKMKMDNVHVHEGLNLIYCNYQFMVHILLYVLQKSSGK